MIEKFEILQDWVASWPTSVIVSCVVYMCYIMICTQIFMIKARDGKYSLHEDWLSGKIHTCSLAYCMAVQVVWTALSVLLILTFAKVSFLSGISETMALVVSLWSMVAFTDEKVGILR